MKSVSGVVMRRSRRCTLTAALLFFCLGNQLEFLGSATSEGGGREGPRDEAGFVPLCNGKDLAGWHGDPRLWTVVDGMIVGSTDHVTIPHNSFLSTEKQFSNFTLRLSVKLRNHNSGVQFRSEQHPDYVVRGYQADVATEKYYGMLYEEGKRGFMDYWKRMSAADQAAVFRNARPDDWNDFEITCEGDHIRIVLNGATVCDIQDPPGSRAGVIALQLHRGAPMMVSFKDIRIKELAH